jgi:hypothetical protein
MMNSTRFNRQARSGHDESGFALVTAMVVLLLVSAVVSNLIGYSGEEAHSSARSRASIENIYAADSGIQLSLQRLQLPRDLTAFSYTLTNQTLVESRSRSDAAALPIAAAGIGPPPDGYSINVGGGFLNELFLLNVTAAATNNGVAELETKLGSLQPNAGAY